MIGVVPTATALPGSFAAVILGASALRRNQWVYLDAVIGVVPTATTLLELGYTWDDVISLKEQGAII